MSWHAQVKALEQENAILREALAESQKRISELERHVKYLEWIIRQYHNENTPSSKQPEWKKSPDRLNKQPATQGKPVGAPGDTRPSPAIDEERVIRLDDESYYGSPLDYVTRVVAEVAPLSPVRWTRFYLARYIDPASGDVVTACYPDCPNVGTFGPNLRGMIVMLRERANLSEQQTARFLQNLYGFDITAGTIEAELARTASALQPQYAALGEAVNVAFVKHSDETGQSVNGKHWCVYCMSTEQNTYMFAHEKKKADYIKQLLDHDQERVLVSDGHSIYDWYHAKQRCWSHATRKDTWLFDEKQTQERAFLHEVVSGTYKTATELIQKKPPGPEHVWDVLFLRNRIEQGAAYTWHDEPCRKVMNYMRNALDDWFTFMLVPGVPPTNNLNERDIRKHVMKRKNCGTFRSEQGLLNHCVILSVLESWKKQGKNDHKTLISALKAYNAKLNWAA